MMVERVEEEAEEKRDMETEKGDYQRVCGWRESRGFIRIRAYTHESVGRI